MNQKPMNEMKEIEIDLGRMFRAILSKAWLIVLVAVICAGLAFGYTKYMVTPLYKSTAMFYVNNNSLSVGDASFSLSSGDLSTSRKLVDSYIVILNTRETLTDVLEYAESTRTYKELRNMISANAVNGTEIFQIVITGPDPSEAEQLANAVVQVLPSRIGEIIEGASAKVVATAVAATTPSSPSYSKSIMTGFMIGFLLMAGLIGLSDVFDIMIRSVEDIAEICNHPVLTSVPDMNASTKGGYDYSYDRYGRYYSRYYDRDAEKKKQPHALYGRNISFAAAESYKLLRTKLQFSFSDESGCRVIGISSSHSGEGKSLSAINLAYTLSQLNKKVILLDCDMRRPTLAEKLGIQKKPGLSNYLTAQSKLVDLVQNCGFTEEEKAFHVISAGQNPPNPVELLSSARMQDMLELLKRAYDYVILDLPPVGEVSDAFAVAKQTDGMLLVVRQNACDRYALTDTIRQFAFIEAKILGVVFNCVKETTSGGYLKKYYYKGRYKKYGRGYGYRSYYRRGSYSRASYKHTAQEQPVINNELDVSVEE